MLFTSRVSQSPIGPYRATAAALSSHQSATAARSVASVCRHTDETLRAAVALWFDDKAAAVARYGPIGDWDTRDVRSMRALFKERADFDEDIGRWNVGRVEDMGYMFCDANKFNQQLAKWDVSSVKDMSYVFFNAASFNQPLWASGTCAASST